MTQDIECDLLVVGSGAAGLATAIQSALPRWRGRDCARVSPEKGHWGSVDMDCSFEWFRLTFHDSAHDGEDA